MNGETDRQRSYRELCHSLLNDLQVLLGAVQLGKGEAELTSVIDRALARIEAARVALTTEEENNNVCR
ncbi:MAG TPA: hypothetical protein VK905_01050 [Bacillota bacterium]|nr:hypothetical protein [Bacillota bacterium]